MKDVEAFLSDVIIIMINGWRAALRAVNTEKLEHNHVT